LKKENHNRPRGNNARKAIEIAGDLTTKEKLELKNKVQIIKNLLKVK
jgi:hypothetical protein